MDLDQAARDYRRAVLGVETAKRAAQRRVDAAAQYRDRAREVLHAAMVEAALEGVRPVELVRRTGYTAERVRQILRAAGVAPD